LSVWLLARQGVSIIASQGRRIRYANRESSASFQAFIPGRKYGPRSGDWLYPLLNVERDKALIESMPDYLAEEIEFAREALPKFYSKIETVLKG
jgi:hypothetical protein